MTNDSDTAAIKARLDALDTNMGIMQTDVKLLLAAEYERRGREQRDNLRDTEDYGDRWQVWFRALLPMTFITAILTTAFNTVWAIWKE